jgi:2-polyprenyl-3-methyl-5-hydroxy-6-metoxy-1,4-benzoquinol methylase
MQARSMGWTVLGVEPDAEAVTTARAQGLQVIEGTVHSVPARFDGSVDAATLSHCIEHVPDPRAVLAAVARLLKPGGWIWIATPNPGGPGLRVFGGAWRGLERSRHLCIPSQTQLRRLLCECCFEQVQLLRRGEHGKTITRESAIVAGIESRQGRPARRVIASMGMPVRVLASLAGSLRPQWGEETVIIARRSGSGS